MIAAEIAAIEVATVEIEAATEETVVVTADIAPSVTGVTDREAIAIVAIGIADIMRGTIVIIDADIGRIIVPEMGLVSTLERQDIVHIAGRQPLIAFTAPSMALTAIISGAPIVSALSLTDGTMATARLSA